MNYNAMPEFTQSDIDRFWRNVAIGKKHECWPWKNSQFRDGYGQIKVFKRNLRAHRVSYYLHYGIDPAENLVCHRCDNPVCCNPFHLFLGTEKDNTQDCKEKGRLSCGIGETHGSKTHPERFARGERVAGSKLTFEKAQQIRKLYAAGGITQEELGKQFGVTRRAIGLITKGKNWKHVIGESESISLTDPLRRSKSGESNSSAKLTENDVRYIRQLHNEGVQTKVISTQFSVTRETIYHILNGLTWKHIQ